MAANIEPIQQPSPTTAAIGTSAITGAASHQGAAYQSAQSSWPNLSQSTSPQIATSPAINMNQHHFHSGTHQTPPDPHPLPATPVSPYHAAAATSHANATYTNGYPLLTQHHHHHHQQQQQQQQQHYIPHHHHQQHQQSHHQAIMQVSSPEEAFSQQHHATYNHQFAHRGQNLQGTPKHLQHQHQQQQNNTTSPMIHHSQIKSEQQAGPVRHYSMTGSGGDSNANLIKVPTTTSENLTQNARANSLGVNSSPIAHQNALASPTNNYYDSNYQDQCHQDYYNNIIHPSHRAANIEPFHQPSSAAAAIGTSATVGAAYQSAQSSWQNLSQSTSPQIATSPAINMNQHHFHSGTHQTPQNPHPLPTAPVSPYHAATGHANATYTNGYPLLTQHHHHHHQQQQQQQQQQHYIPHHHHHQQHQQSHHQAIMQVSSPEGAFSQQHHQSHNQSHATYNHQFAHRGQNLQGTPKHLQHQHQQQQNNTTSPMIHHSQIKSEQQAGPVRHYSMTGSGGDSNANLIKVPTTTSENLTQNARANSLGVNSSPMAHQNALASPTAVINNNGQNASRRQSSSVVSTTSSTGSNLSDHHSPTESPSSAPPGQTVTQQTLGGESQSTGANIKIGAANRLTVSLEDRLSANVAADPEQDSKESLSQLRQQCAVLLDEQQQQQHNIVINSPSSNNNGTNATNSANNNNGTPSNGNNSGRSKRLRTSFKHNQLKEMKKWFQRNQNPDAKDLKTLAQTTGLSKRVLQVWFQNARAKYRRSNAKAANQQLYDVNQHTSQMLQFQQHQQQNYHHHHHHHHPRPMADSQPINQQQVGQQPHHHLHLPNQGSRTTTTAIPRTYAPLTTGGGDVTHQAGVLVAADATNLVDQQQQPAPNTTATTTTGG